MTEKNRQLVTDEPVEFEKSPVEAQDFRKITHQFRGIYRIYPNLVKQNQSMSTCSDRLDLQTLGSQPIMMPNNLPNLCSGAYPLSQNTEVCWMCFWKISQTMQPALNGRGDCWLNDLYQDNIQINLHRYAWNTSRNSGPMQARDVELVKHRIVQLYLCGVCSSGAAFNPCPSSCVPAAAVPPNRALS
jgi:hypothetical protein